MFVKCQPSSLQLSLLSSSSDRLNVSSQRTMGIEWWLEAQVWVHWHLFPQILVNLSCPCTQSVSAQWWWVEPIVIKFHIHLLSMFSWQWFEVTQESENLSLCVPVSGPVSQPPPSKNTPVFSVLYSLIVHPSLFSPDSPTFLLWVPPLNLPVGRKNLAFLLQHWRLNSPSQRHPHTQFTPSSPIYRGPTYTAHHWDCERPICIAEKWQAVFLIPPWCLHHPTSVVDIAQASQTNF